MQKLKFLSIILISGMLFSCASQSKVTAQKRAKQETTFLTSRVSSYKKLEFERYFYEGIKERNNANYARAAQQFEKAAENDPENAAAQYELGRAYLKLGRLAAAEVSASKAANLEPQNKWYQVFLADIYGYQSKWAEGASIYQKLLNSHPEQYEYYLQLAEFNIKGGKVNDALKAYELLEKQFGASEDITLMKQRIYYSTGDFNKAESEIKKLLAKEPNNTKYYQILADIYVKSNNSAKALETYKKLLDLNPNDGIAQLSLAEYYYRKEDTKNAFDMMQKAFSNPTLDVDKKIAILYSYYLMPQKISEEKKKESYILTDMMAKTHPGDAKVHAIYGDFLFQDKKFEEAKIEYQKSLKVRKDVFAVWQQIFTIDAELNDFKSLAEDAQEALQYFPSQPIVYFFSGVAKNQMKKYNEGIEDLQTGLSYLVDNSMLESQFLINIADAYNQLKSYEDADLNFEKALKLDPDNALALNNYAYYLSVRNVRLDKAADMSKRSLTLDSENASYLDTYGWILYKKGNYREAEQFIKKSLDKEGDNADVLEHYGDVLFKLGQTDKALDYWKKAKQNGDGSDYLDKKIKDKKIYE